ncbi:MAG TPA: 2-dehydropantoate 2-reductase [Rectinemataceae bacterium]
MDIGVIGLGGVGGYFGGKLASWAEKAGAEDAHVHFVARGAHLDAIRARGLEVDAQEGPFLARPASATDRIADLPALDACVLCVKGYDLVEAVERLKPKLKESTLILPLLNGVDIFERIRAVCSSGYLHPACVYISGRIEGPGKVVQRGPRPSILLGADPGGRTEDRSLLAVLDAAGIAASWRDDPFADIWIKYLFIAPFGLVTAKTGLTIGEVFQSTEALALVKEIMGEILALAAAKGVELPTTAFADTLAKAASFPPDTRTSFQRDFSSPGKPDERDLFGGSIIRMGSRLGVPTPATDRLYEELSRKKPL